MDDIAKSLGMSKKTIYEQYEDKNHLVVALTISEIDQQIKDMEKARKTSENAIDEIFKGMNCMAEMFTKINANMLYDLQRHFPTAWQKFLEFKEKKVRSF